MAALAVCSAALAAVRPRRRYVESSLSAEAASATRRWRITNTANGRYIEGDIPREPWNRWAITYTPQELARLGEGPKWYTCHPPQA